MKLFCHIVRLLKSIRNYQTVFQIMLLFCKPTSIVQKFKLLHILANPWNFRPLNLNHYNRCVAVFHCDSDLHFFDD